jgi:hypothetical protein
MTLHYLVDTDWAIHYLQGQALLQIYIFDAKSQNPVLDNQWLVSPKFLFSEICDRVPQLLTLPLNTAILCLLPTMPKR